MKGGKIIFRNILLDLKKVDGVKIIAVGSRDGFLIGESNNSESEILTLMSAVMLKAAENVIGKFGKVSSMRVIVDFEGGKIITTLAGYKAFIAVITSMDANIEPIIREMDRTASKLKDIL